MSPVVQQMGADPRKRLCRMRGLLQRAIAAIEITGRRPGCYRHTFAG